MLAQARGPSQDLVPATRFRGRIRGAMKSILFIYYYKILVARMGLKLQLFSLVLGLVWVGPNTRYPACAAGRFSGIEGVVMAPARLIA